MLAQTKSSVYTIISTNGLNVLDNIQKILLPIPHQYKMLNTFSIIGTGGVEHGRDVFEHVLCGASAVQIGTILVDENVSVFERLEAELTDWLKLRGYSSLMECKGRLKEL